MTLTYAFDPYTAARVALDLDLIKAANPGCFTLLGVPYVATTTLAGVVLQKAGKPCGKGWIAEAKQCASDKRQHAIKNRRGDLERFANTNRQAKGMKPRQQAATPAAAPTPQALMAQAKAIAGKPTTAPPAAAPAKPPKGAGKQPKRAKAGKPNFAEQLHDAKAEELKSPKMRARLPKTNDPAFEQVKNGIFDYFGVSTVGQLKNKGSFKMATDGMDFDFGNADKWKELYRKTGKTVPGEESEQGRGVINGVNVLKYFKPWKMFGIADPKTATDDDVRAAYKRLSKIYHPDVPGTGDAEIFDKINLAYQSLVAGSDADTTRAPTKPQAKKRSRKTKQTKSPNLGPFALPPISDRTMTKTLSLAGVSYVATMTPAGIVLQKAGRRAAPGQLGLFAGAAPKVGDTKVEGGTTYRLNENSRWTRTDKGTGQAANPGLAVLRDEPAAAEVDATPMDGAGDDAIAEIPTHEEMVLEAEVFRFLTAKETEKHDDSRVIREIGDLNTRSGRDKYLIDKYGIAPDVARNATNAGDGLPQIFTIGDGRVNWHPAKASPIGLTEEPQIDDYPDIQAMVAAAVATGEAKSRARDEATAANNAKPGQADLNKVPPGIASKLRAAMVPVNAWNKKIELARQTDQQFQGGGRYTWEATGGTQMEEPETLQIFRKMAPKNGIDADAALAAMGYEPPTQLDPKELHENNVGAAGDDAIAEFRRIIRPALSGGVGNPEQFIETRKKLTGLSDAQADQVLSEERSAIAGGIDRTPADPYRSAAAEPAAGGEGFKGFDDPWKHLTPEDRREVNRLQSAIFKAFPSSPKQKDLQTQKNAILEKYKGQGAAAEPAAGGGDRKPLRAMGAGHEPIMFNPWQNNVLDYVGRKDLASSDGQPVKIGQNMNGTFDVHIGSEKSYQLDNSAATSLLNQADVGIAGSTPAPVAAPTPEPVTPADADAARQVVAALGGTSASEKKYQQKLKAAIAGATKDPSREGIQKAIEATNKAESYWSKTVRAELWGADDLDATSNTAYDAAAAVRRWLNGPHSDYAGSVEQSKRDAAIARIDSEERQAKATQTGAQRRYLSEVNELKRYGTGSGMAKALTVGGARYALVGATLRRI